MQNIGIVGGGKAGLRLLQMLSQSDAVTVLFVVDIRADAPAVVAARELRIATYADPADAMRIHKPDLVFEVTGLDDVSGRVHELCAGIADVVSAAATQAILESLEGNHRALTGQVVTDVTGIKSQIEGSLGEMRSVIESIDTITSNMQMLALNARIEAARVGDEGRGFAVVAQEMAGSTELIRRAARQLEQLNVSLEAVGSGLDAALNRLG